MLNDISLCFEHFIMHLQPIKKMRVYFWLLLTYILRSPFLPFILNTITLLHIWNLNVIVWHRPTRRGKLIYHSLMISLVSFFLTLFAGFDSYLQTIYIWDSFRPYVKCWLVWSIFHCHGLRLSWNTSWRYICSKHVFWQMEEKVQRQKTDKSFR